MTGCGCRYSANSNEEKRVLKIALVLNASMFVIGFVSGVFSGSIALISDSLDMLADAIVYFLGMWAVGRTLYVKSVIAKLSGILLLFLGAGVLIEVSRRAWLGSSPESIVMIVVASLSLLVNITVLTLLKRFRNGEVHLRATWIFTRADVIANLGVILSGVLVILTKSRYPDLIAGLLIGIYVIKEAVEIIKISGINKT